MLFYCDIYIEVTSKDPGIAPWYSRAFLIISRIKKILLFLRHVFNSLAAQTLCLRSFGTQMTVGRGSGQQNYVFNGLLYALLFDRNFLSTQWGEESFVYLREKIKRTAMLLL